MDFFRFDEAGKMKDQYVSLEHLLLALTLIHSKPRDILKNNGINREDIFNLHKAWGKNITSEFNDAYTQHEMAMKTAVQEV